MASNNQNQYKHCFKKILLTHTHKKIEEKVKKEAFLENPLTHKKYTFSLFSTVYVSLKEWEQRRSKVCSPDFGPSFAPFPYHFVSTTETAT